MQPTCELPSEQHLRARLDSVGVFNLITDDRFLAIIEAQLPAHREHTLSTERDSGDVRRTGAQRRQLLPTGGQRSHHPLSEPRIASTGTSSAAYCEARARLPVLLVETLFKAVGQQVSDNALPEWLWRWRPVYFIDGTGLSMPDTTDNQREFPQPSSQKKGVGFPEARFGCIVVRGHGCDH